MNSSDEIIEDWTHIKVYDLNTDYLSSVVGLGQFPVLPVRSGV